MATFKYENISLKRPSFRLLRLLNSDSNDDSIKCELFESRLPPSEDVGDYAAISYTWGSRYKPFEVIINGSRTAVTKNVYLLLRDLRCQKKDKDLIFWIDALCIDQDNEEERGQQVQQMGSIYSNAERVIIWLGESTFDTDYAMDHMKQLEQQLEKDDMKCISSSLETLHEHLESTWSTLTHSLNDALMDLLVEGLQSLLHRKWYTRVWIIQEAVNAQAAEIFCGSKSVSASIFTYMPSLLKITPNSYWEPILNVLPGPLRDHSWWSERPNLFTMLNKFQNSEATDPRDHIYALLDISSDTYKADLLKADYTKDIKDVIFDTVSFLLDFHKLDPGPRRFFDWESSKLLDNLNSLPNEVLKCAIGKDQGAVIELLVMRHDIDVNVKTYWGGTALLWAASHGHEGVMKLLLAKDQVNINCEDYEGRTPLHYAAMNRHAAVVKLLLDKYEIRVCAIDQKLRTPLLLAAANGDEEIVKLLFARRIGDMDYKSFVLYINGRDLTGMNPLLWAAKKGHDAVVQLLLAKYKVDINCEDRRGRTPLSWAVENGHVAVVKLLLTKHGIEVNCQDENLQTPLLLAVKSGQAELVELLLTEGKAHVNRTVLGASPLSLAQKLGNEEIANMLVRHGAIQSKRHIRKGFKRRRI